MFVCLSKMGEEKNTIGVVSWIQLGVVKFLRPLQIMGIGRGDCGAIKDIMVAVYGKVQLMETQVLRTSSCSA